MAGILSTAAVVLLLMLFAILPLGLQQALSRYAVPCPSVCLRCKMVQNLPTAPPCSVSSTLGWPVECGCIEVGAALQVSHSSEEVLQLKKEIARCQVEAEKMRTAIALNKV